LGYNDKLPHQQKVLRRIKYPDKMNSISYLYNVIIGITLLTRKKQKLHKSHDEWWYYIMSNSHGAVTPVCQLHHENQSKNNQNKLTFVSF